MLKVGVCGYGYWGPQLVRNFNRYPEMKVIGICDKIEKDTPEYMGDDYDRLLTYLIDLVVIATPVSTHYELANKALDAGKHVLIEKPMTDNVDDAKRLIDKALKKNLQIFVDHTFLFNPAVNKIKFLLDNSEIGKPLYYDSTRINLGLFQSDVNVVCDLATHDLSIIDYLFESECIDVIAAGADHFNRKLENTAYVTMYLENSVIVHLNLNWLSPIKIRQTIIGGDKKAILWDDLEIDKKISIYDKSAVKTTSQVEYRIGDIVCPYIEKTEPLFSLCDYIYCCINGNLENTLINGQRGAKIVSMLERINNNIINWRII